MPIRFRRTLKIAPGVRINFSKSGMSTTVGRKGFHFTFNKRGIRRDVGIPGTGISEVDYIKKNKREAEKQREEKTAERGEARHEKKASPAGRAVPVTGHAHARAMSGSSAGLRNAFVLVAIVVFFFVGAAVFGLIPADFLPNLAQYIAHAVQGIMH